MNKIASRTAATAPPSTNSTAWFIGGAVWLAVGLAAAGVLAWSHFTGLSAPGCGAGSACDAAARSLWSLAGVAYFGALLAGWLSARGAPGTQFKWIVRGGILISLLLLGTMAVDRLWCEYCLTVHVANLAFWLVAEKSSTAGVNRRVLAATAGAFIALTAALGLTETLTRRSVAEQRTGELASTTQQIIEKTAAAGVAAAPSSEGGFTGRYLHGPANAPIRLVIISDYQCVDCNEIDRQLNQILAQRNDISLSAKHYPFSSDCNKYLGKANMHPNACWAARAAEAAGILGGNDGFWRMHRWLFARYGSFTDAQLHAALPGLGFDPQTFVATMQSPRTLEFVQADIEEATALGLHFTPMIFINGVELRGFIKNPTALSRAIEALAATNPPPGSPEQDRPPLALQKAIEDWRFQPTMNMANLPPTWPLGPEDARINVVVWTDVELSYSAELERVIREQMSKYGDIQYTFRGYPMDKACNPNTVQERPAACWAAAAGEAAGLLGGGEAYWKVHDWLLSHQNELNDEALRAAAPSLGLDGDRLIQTVHSQQVSDLVLAQSRAARPFVHRGAPTVYINGRYIQRWKFSGIMVVREIIETVRAGG